MIGTGAPYVPPHEDDWPAGSRDLADSLRKFYHGSGRCVRWSEVVLRSSPPHLVVGSAFPSCSFNFSPSREVLGDLAWQLYHAAEEARTRELACGQDVSSYSYALFVRGEVVRSSSSGALTGPEEETFSVKLPLCNICSDPRIKDYLQKRGLVP